MGKKIVLMIFAGLLSSCASTELENKDPVSLKNMTHFYESQLMEQGFDVENFAVIENDFSKAYGTARGDFTPTLGVLDEYTGKVSLPDGSELLSDNNNRSKSNLNPQLLACEPYIQLKSKQAYTGGESKLTLPTTTKGLDASKESAYMYIGLYTNSQIGSGGKTEAGFVTTAGDYSYMALNKWYSYASFVPAGGGSTFYVYNNLGELTNSSSNGILPGTRAYVSQRIVYLQEPNMLDTYYYKILTTWEIYSSSGLIAGTYSYVYPKTGNYLSGFNKHSIGRTTSYLSNTRNSGDAIFDAKWYNSKVIYTQGTNEVFSTTTASMNTGNTAVYSYGDVQNCFTNGYFKKSVTVNSYYDSVNESIYVP